MSGDPAQDYFSDGIVEGHHHRPVALPGTWFVIARNSTFTYKGRTVDVTQIGRELSVAYVSKEACAREATASGSRHS